MNGLLHKNSQWQYTNKKSGLNPHNKAFTLVELIVVITILAILWTIAFISFQWYSSNARDWVRTADMNNINKWLALFQLKWWIYPKPDNSVTISASGTIIWYEWVVWENASRIINTNKIILDPLDNTSYVYYTNATNTTYQLLWYLEWNSLTQNNLINTTYAATDYTKRYPKVLWNNLWILLDTSNNQITTNIDLFLAQSWVTYNSYISNTTIKTLSWVELWWPLITLSRSLNFESPTTCPEWFIKVPWNEEFMQPGFCVMKYEATYTDADTPNTCDWTCPATPVENTAGTTYRTDWNTVTYTWAKIPVSMVWKYPIAKITQLQAIDACSKMWAWYHLITNNEWMTIARDIEANKDNWSTSIVWSWFIYNWVSNSTMWCAWVTKTIYPSLTRNRVTKTWWWFGNDTCDAKRQLQLSNWEIVWDLAWNVWEHVNKANTIDWYLYATWTNPDILSTNNAWWEWSSTTQVYRNLYWPSIWIDANNGIWRIYQADWTVFIRGASAGSASYAGVFTMDLDRPSGFQYRHVGFRCAK